MSALSSSIAAALGYLLSVSPPLHPSSPASHGGISSCQQAHETISVQATLSYTGSPCYVALRLPGRLLAQHHHLPEGGYSTCFTIPAEVHSMEILIEMRWPETTSPRSEHRVILTLSAEERAPRAQSCGARGRYLHDLLLFTW